MNRKGKKSQRNELTKITRNRFCFAIFCCCSKSFKRTRVCVANAAFVATESKEIHFEFRPLLSVLMFLLWKQMQHRKFRFYIYLPIFMFFLFYFVSDFSFFHSSLFSDIVFSSFERVHIAQVHENESLRKRNKKENSKCNENIMEIYVFYYCIEVRWWRRCTLNNKQNKRQKGKMKRKTIRNRWTSKNFTLKTVISKYIDERHDGTDLSQFQHWTQERNSRRKEKSQANAESQSANAFNFDLQSQHYFYGFFFSLSFVITKCCSPVRCVVGFHCFFLLFQFISMSFPSSRFVAIVARMKSILTDENSNTR